MATTTYALYVDWSGDGDFGDTGEIITDRVLSVDTERGRDFPSQLTGKSIAGKLIAVLNNESGDYSPFKSDGDLYGNLLPGRRVQLIAAYNQQFTYTFPFTFMNSPLWTGYVESIRPTVVVGNVKTATLSAIGPLGLIAERDTRVSLLSSKRTDELVSEILEDAGWDTDDLDLEEGQTTVTKYFSASGSALKALREVEDTESGFIYEKHDGKIKFENRSFRMTNDRSRTSQLTFSDASDTVYAYEAIVQEDPLPSIFNVFEATVVTYSTASIATLWTLSETGSSSPSLASGTANTYYAQFPPMVDGILASEIAGQVTVNEWTTPVANTDYTVNAAADGTGTNLTSSVAISVSKSSNQMKIELTNNSATDGFITLLKARGTTLTTSDPTLVIAEDATSQTSFLKRTYRSRSKWLPTSAEAQNWVDYSLSIFKDPLPRLALSFTANKSGAELFAALDLDISDRVTVTATSNNTKLGINTDFIVENIRHRVTEGNTLHQTTFELSAASGIAGFWALDYGNLDIDTKLNY